MSIGPISFAMPAAFGLLPAAVGFLVYVYRKRRPPVGVGVGTLFLLKNLPRATPRSKGFLPPLQFWIDLLGLIVLIVLLAWPSLDTKTHRIAVIIDNSVSMAASSTRGGESFLKAALEAARQSLLNVDSSNMISIFAGSPSLRPLTTEPISPRETSRILDSISIAYSTDSLARQTDRLLHDPIFDGVLVYSDQDIEQPLDSASVSAKLTAVNVRTATRSAELANVSLSRLESIEVEGASTIRASIKNYSSRSARVRLKLSIAGPSLSFENSHDQSVISLSANEEKETLFTPKISKWVFAKAELAVEDWNEPTHFDALSVDDTAWVSRSHSQKTIQVIGPLSPAQLKIDGLLGLHFKWDPTRQDESGLDPLLPTLFHRVTPNRELKAPTLIVFPNPDTVMGVARVGSTIANPTVTRWLESHQLTSYINLQSLVIPQAHLLEPSPSAQTIIATDKGSALVAGELPSGAGRVAISGVELFPFSASETPALSILTLNLFKWVFGSDPTGAAVSPYEPLPKSSTASSYSYLDSLSALSSREFSMNVPITQPGLIKFGDELVAVHFNDEAELDLRQIRHSILSFSSSTQTRKENDGTSNSVSLVRSLCLFLIALFALDTILRFRQIARSRGN